MGQRLKLDEIIRSVADNVYYQPPDSKQLSYPCVVYQRAPSDTEFGDNRPYVYTRRYQAVVIYTNPDDPLPDMFAQLPVQITSDRNYVAGNLYHAAFNIYY